MTHHTLEDRLANRARDFGAWLGEGRVRNAFASGRFRRDRVAPAARNYWVNSARPTLARGVRTARNTAVALWREVDRELSARGQSYIELGLGVAASLYGFSQVKHGAGYNNYSEAFVGTAIVAAGAYAISHGIKDWQRGYKRK